MPQNGPFCHGRFLKTNKSTSRKIYRYKVFKVLESKMTTCKKLNVSPPFSWSFQYFVLHWLHFSPFTSFNLIKSLFQVYSRGTMYKSTFHLNKKFIKLHLQNPSPGINAESGVRILAKLNTLQNILYFIDHRLRIYNGEKKSLFTDFYNIQLKVHLYKHLMHQFCY